MNDVPISVIIPTLNEENYIEPLLRSLKPQLKRGDEIIIVDSKSSDDTVKIAKKYTKKILFMSRLGIGPAKTYGARHAKNDIVAFIDADSVVTKGWLERTRVAFAEGADAFYGRVFYSSPSVLRQFIYNFWSGSTYLMSEIMLLFVEVFWALPNNCAFDRDLFLKSGGYRSVICEDWDLAARFKKLRGIRYVYDKDSIIYISDRRFRKIGFFRTVADWAFHALSILTSGPVANSRKYGIVR